MKSLFVIAVCLLSHTSFSQDVTDSGFGKPLFLYTIYNPWAMFIGSDEPVMTVYENGKIIYWRDKQYHLSKVTKSELQRILSQLKLDDTCFSKSKYFETSSYSDEPSSVLYTNLDTVKSFYVYGSLNFMQARDAVPRQLVEVYDFVMNYEDNWSENWLPDKIELLLSDYPHSPEKPLEWPKDWPDLRQSVVKDGQVRTLLLDKKYFDQLVALLKTRKEKQAIRISGYKYYVEYRFPLPNLPRVSVDVQH